MNKRILFLLSVALGFLFNAQNIQNNPQSNHGNKFEQLGTILPTPNTYRTASGAPGHEYWQQKADYDISCYLDEEKLNLKGTETITYYNNSPDELEYLWFQLDENEQSSVKNANYQTSSTLPERTTMNRVEITNLPEKDNGYGVNIEKVVDAQGKAIPYVINKTMMRVDLPKKLKKGEVYKLTIQWNYNIPDRMTMGGRGGYEFFKEDGNYIFTMAQWYPRLCVYSDFKGWQHQQFTGRGEFALTFGDFKVSMNVPADHMVASTGEGKSYQQNLTPAQYQRYLQSQNAKEPVEIVTLEEAKQAELSQTKARKTWVYEAKNVRDFAWTSSPKFIWDAMPQVIERTNHKVMCMSLYPKEAYALYRKFSTKVVAHTIKTYSDFTIPYPYPVAQSIEASSGMEYPMICFNFGRTEKDGTYSEAVKHGMIGVIIHEVGHNFFPMIINSDERQWSWLDEGLNTFVQFLTEELWDSKFPSRRGPAHTIVDYMKLPKDQLEPIMVNSDNIIHFGPNAYSKPATGLNILRETIMGRELFDKAFKTYSRRWAFRHPEPADFFRTMEDVSGEDLDWFWRGWFYGIDPCDIAIENVKVAEADPNATPPPAKEETYKVEKPEASTNFESVTKMKNKADKNIKFYSENDPTVQDFYYRYARGLEKVDTEKTYTQKVNNFSEMTDAEKSQFKNITGYQIDFANKGGLVMPIIVEFTFEDGTKKIDRIPAQIWRKNENKVSKAYYFDKKVKSIQLDPHKETADIDTSNNHWGTMPEPSKFQIFKQSEERRRGGARERMNPMQVAEKK